MADIFEAAVGWNNPGALLPFTYAPDTDGLYYPREIDVPSGLVFDDGALCLQLRFPQVLRETEAQLVLSRLGLDNRLVKSARVTVRVPLDTALATWGNFNAIAVRWTPGRGIRHNYCWYEQPVIDLVRLVAL